MDNNKLNFFKARVAAAKGGDTVAARSLIIDIKNWLPKYAGMSSKLMIEEGGMLIDMEVVKYLYDCFVRIENGDSADQAFLLKQKGGGRPKNKASDFKIAIAMRDLISSGISQNKAAEKVSKIFHSSSSNVIRKYKIFYPDE